jgi:hypothetical protein
VLSSAYMSTVHILQARMSPSRSPPVNSTPEVAKMDKIEWDRLFAPRQNKVNPHNFRFKISGSRLCLASTAPFMVVLVPSLHHHIHVRQTIRSTWGSVTTGSVWPNKSLTAAVKLVFLFGKGATPEMDAIVKNESVIYGDVVQGDFVESYFNLSRKILMGIKWVNIYCSEVDFILKADEDTFVHIPKLVRFLQTETTGVKEGTIYGNINYNSKVRRTGKWKVSTKEYAESHYPPYASGNTYVISGNLASRLFRLSEYFPYLRIEDAYITGVLARVVRCQHVGVPGFTFWMDTTPTSCDFAMDHRISATKVGAILMQSLWSSLHNETLDCPDEYAEY